MGRMWIMIDPSRCAGCRLCEVACSLKHEGIIWPEASRIRVFEFAPGVNVPITCFQCPDYPCVKACPVKALSVDPNTGAVIVDPIKCELRGECIEACPAKIPRIPKGKDFVVICDLCGGDPECVKVCNAAGHGALKLVEGPPPKIIKTFVREPIEIAKDLAKKLYGDKEVI
mgnify:FL=1